MHALLPHFDGDELGAAMRGWWCADYCPGDGFTPCPTEADLQIHAREFLLAIDAATRELFDTALDAAYFAGLRSPRTDPWRSRIRGQADLLHLIGILTDAARYT